MVGKIRSLNLDTLNLKYLLDVQVEMLDYRGLGFRGDIGLEINTGPLVVYAWHLKP